MNYKIVIVINFLVTIFLTSSIFAEEILTKEKALSIAIKNSFKIKVFKKEIEYKRLLGESEILYINPELEIEVSDFLGTKNYSGFKSSGVGITLSQEIILGSKNSKIEKLTNSKIETVKLNIKKEKLELKYQIEHFFIDILIEKEFYKVAKNNQKIAIEIYQTVKDKKESGAISELEVLKSEINYKNSKIELSKYENRIDKLKKSLTILLGNENLNFIIEGELKKELDFKKEKNSENIDILIQKSVIKNSKKELFVEKSNKIPNLTLSLGANRYQELGEYSFTLALSIPLPIWNSNSKKVDSIYSKISKGKIGVDLIKKELNEKLTEKYQALVITINELKQIKNDILPLTERSLNLAKEGYKEGKFKYLELLDAQKTSLEIKKHYIELLGKYNILILNIDYLLGRIK